MDTRIIWTKIWQDSYFAELNKTEKLLFFYYLTNPKINIISLYEIPDRIVIFDIQCSKNELDDFKINMMNDKKMFFRDDYVYITNAYKYQNYKGEKNDIAKIKKYELIPKDIFREFDRAVNNRLSIHYQNCLDTTKNTNQKSYNKDINTESKIYESEIEDTNTETKNDKFQTINEDDLQNKIDKYINWNK